MFLNFFRFKRELKQSDFLGFDKAYDAVQNKVSNFARLYDEAATDVMQAMAAASPVFAESTSKKRFVFTADAKVAYWMIEHYKFSRLVCNM